MAQRSKNPTWIEVALNGGGPLHVQPRIPVHPKDIVADAIACAKAGAAVIHLHARDERTGEQVDDVESYAHIIEAIRSQVDAIIYPTVPLAGAPELRFRTCEALARRGLLEWSVVEPGSVLFATDTGVAGGENGWIYENTGAHVRTAMTLAAEHGLAPTYSIYELGFVRLARAAARLFPALLSGVYRFMLSDAFTFGLRPNERALETYAAALHAEAPGAEWMMAGLLFDPRTLLSAAIELGGHVRIGLEDAPAHSSLSNAQWVELAVQVALRHGPIATAAHIRSQVGGKRSGA